MATALIFLGALLVLGWGFYRAKPYGQAGILSWLQSVALLLPWLVLFGLPLLGLFPNLAVVLFLVVASVVLYITLGNRLRLMAQQEGVAYSPDAANDAARSPSTLSQKPPQVSPESSQGGQHSPTDPPTDTRSEQERLAPGQPELASSEDNRDDKISSEDLAEIRLIFGIDTFFATETVPYQGGAIFKGNLRGSNAAETHRILSEQLSERVGDRYRLFLLDGPEDKPVVIVLPTGSSDPPQSSRTQWLFSLVLLAATTATSLETAGILQGFDFFNEPGHFSESWPIAISIILVLLAHETGHWLQARQYGVRLGPPFFIPAWQIGSFGALTRFESVLPNRSVLFDISVAGPVMGGALSLSFLVAGLFLSHQGSAFQIPSQFFQGSVLVGTLSQAVMGPALQQPLVDIHPLTIVGWLGLVITAINVMPAGQLDGGRIIQAIYGRKIARRATIITLIVLAIATLANPLALYWAIVILFLQRDLERPSLDELTEPNDARATIALFVLFLTAAVLLPMPPRLAEIIGIGG